MAMNDRNDGLGDPCPKLIDKRSACRGSRATNSRESLVAESSYRQSREISRFLLTQRQ